MKRDAIERLAIDSASGELNEDVQALLSEYLAENADASGWVQDMQWLCEKTEAAIQAKTRDAGASREMTTVTAAPAPQMTWWPVARWAAAVALAAIVGFNVGRRHKNDGIYERVLPQSPSARRPVETVDDLREQYAGTFWGDKMLAVIESRPGQRYGVGQRGERLWDRYGQYVREKRHE